jgi:hypothetical protein
VLADDEALDAISPFSYTSFEAYRVLNTMIGALTDPSKRAKGANFLLDDASSRWKDETPGGIENKRRNFGAFKRLLQPARALRSPCTLSARLGLQDRAAAKLSRETRRQQHVR